MLCSCVEELNDFRPKDRRPVHMLWALLVLKMYGTGDVLSVLAGTDRKTMRKWSWQFIAPISYLDVVCSTTQKSRIRLN